jgi:hypothetical protein
MDVLHIGLVVLALLGAVAAVSFAILRAKAGTEARAVAARNETLSREVAALSAQVRDLARYRSIVDAEAAAAAIRAQGGAEGAHVVEVARAEADRVRGEAMEAANRLELAVETRRAQIEAWGAQVAQQAHADAERAQAQALALRREAESSAAARQAQIEAWGAGVARQSQADAERIRRDAEARASEIYAEATVRRSQVEAWAEQLAAKAHADAERSRGEAQAMVNEARAAAVALRAQAETSAAQVSAQARAEAERTVQEAQRRAEGTAGEALAAVQDAKRLEQVARAMRNVIEGYGDQYVMPTAGLLDELAEELGFAEAGKSLKAARDRTRSMINQGLAAKCDYVEANRRTTAIEFVLDAFNGKVDTVLADVRHDNHGTLEQKIRDAYLLVNENGRAFRNARITPEYLHARLDELRWAVLAQELKLREREEQRVLKERIRDEESAQKEFDRALRDAQKEEDVLRKAMEKARAEINKATDAQRAVYEEQLRELSERLRAAEEKNQRALSMAQQTRAGNVYVISNVGSFGEEVFKIGMTRRLDPLDRVRELGDASVPFEFDVHVLIRTEDAPALERALHQRFARKLVNKVNFRKEFFRVALHEVRAEVERMGIASSWTLTAAAREFRETQAIERQMAGTTFDEATWLARRMPEADVVVTDEPPPVEATA